MSALQLSQFPLEILEIIIRDLPRSELYKLDGIDYLKDLVLRSIYSSVKITGELPLDSTWADQSISQHLKYPETNELTPEFYCFKSLTDFLDQNNLPMPRHINFFHPIELILVHYRDPNILQNCTIETSFRIFFDSERYNFLLRRSYLSKLIALPLKFRGAQYCEILDEMMDEWGYQFTRNLTSASFTMKFPLYDTFKNDRYKNLTTLKIASRFSHKMVKYIPRSVEKLSCNISCPQNELKELGFPYGLRSLKVSWHNYPEKCSLDFSYLGQLVDLESDVIKKDRIAFYNVSFPRSLKSVGSFGLDMELLKNQCPELTSIHCMTVRHAERKGNSFNFPEKSTHLRVEAGVLEHIEKCENDSSIKFPKNLQSLYVVGNPRVRGQEVEFDESRSLFSNKEENILQNLKSLTLFRVEMFMRFGQIPQSLSQLTIRSPSEKVGPSNDEFFDNLKNVTSLKVLKIHCPLGSSFEYELPPKLQCFVFFNPNLSKISLRSESLQILRLNEGKFNDVTPENVQIPGSLVELALYDCGITFFDDSFEFPKNLQILNLNGNKLEKIPKLPPNLKSFSSNYGAIKPDQSDFAELPTALEEFNLESNSDPDECSLIPDLSRLVNLKKLSLSSFMFKGFGIASVNLGNFPKSLTHLSMVYCQIQKFTGTFADFPKLEHLDLAGSILDDWLVSLPNEFLFGTAIRTVSLDGMDIDADTIRTLLFKLKKNPNFRSLIVDLMSIPEDMQHLFMDRSLVQVEYE
ncbi:hypothetical protein G210_5199 [Candida maltosa Xu316]|uniref:F-box domain-containing protein n=1 Tax=Candida maltosa (strain Xu316) TaxID=1245528 RepID=M3K3P6_CANMX|nr:hypothetical protein G210_5199 [Candida maltosa Xu316]